jgi:hypothetical protein
MTFVLTVYRLANLLGAMMSADIENALKIKAALESLGPEYKVNVQTLTDAAEHANKATLDRVNAWLANEGFEPLPADAGKVK